MKYTFVFFAVINNKSNNNQYTLSLLCIILLNPLKKDYAYHHTHLVREDIESEGDLVTCSRSDSY